MGSILINAALNYIESNPQIVEELFAQVIPAIINALKKHNASQTVVQTNAPAPK